MPPALRRILHIARKEVLQIRRDRMMPRIIFLSPLVQLVVFGCAITADIRHVPAAVIDLDQTSASRALVERFAAAGDTFDIRWRPQRLRDADALLDAGDAAVVICVPKGYARDTGTGRTASVQALLDGTDSRTASVVSGYVTAIVEGHSARTAVGLALRRGGASAASAAIELRPRAWYNPDLRNVNYLVPGVLCLILLVVTMLLTSLAVVREREIGTLEQLIVTPIRPLELMAGKIAPFAVIGFIDVLIIVACSRWWFGVTVAGSLPLLLGLTTLFLAASLGLGLFISTISRTQQQAMLTSVFIMQPQILLSGFMFPIENMPPVIQWLTCAIPLRYYLEIVRGIYLRGVGLEVLWPQALALAAIGGGLFAASAMRFTRHVG